MKIEILAVVLLGIYVRILVTPEEFGVVQSTVDAIGVVYLALTGMVLFVTREDLKTATMVRRTLMWPVFFMILFVYGIGYILNGIIMPLALCFGIADRKNWNWLTRVEEYILAGKFLKG